MPHKAFLALSALPTLLFLAARWHLHSLEGWATLGASVAYGWVAAYFAAHWLLR